MTAHSAEVVWYVTGRFYSTTSESGATLLQDAGYFLHVQGIDQPLFDGQMSEEKALLTFSASPFASSSVTNGSLQIGVDLKGIFRIFLRKGAGASFDRVESFSEGQCVATLARVAIVPTVNIDGTLLANVFTARLVSSEPFALGGRRYDFRELIGFGITQWGTASDTAASSGVPFVGSAIRIGAG